VWETLKKAGIEPSPRRTGPTWSQILRSQAEALLATDFFTADLLDGTTPYVMAVIEHSTRRIHILGVTAHLTGAWVTHQARNLLMDLDSQTEAIRFLVRDRDTKFTAAFDEVFRAACIRILKKPGSGTRANAIAERWIGGCRRELLDRTLIWNQPHLLHMLRVYEAHHNQHRPHHSLGQAAPFRPLPDAADLAIIRTRRRDLIGGVIHEYAQVA
jgi:hypothetical protein